MISEHIQSAKIMIIDDDIGMMDVLSAILSKYNHQLFPFTEPVAAIEALKADSFDILIVNYLMSPVNGDRIIELVRQFNKDIYIILISTHKDLVPSIDTMQNLDIQGYFEKSAHFDQLIMMIQSGIKYIEQLNHIKNMSIQLEQYLIDFANVLLNTVTAKDHYTGDHSYRVSKIAELFGQYLNLSTADKESLALAGMFHDIGKIGISDNILLKEDKLSDFEYESIKLHPIIGANILSVSKMFNTSSPAIRGHHEKYDGSGYPDKLKGENIPYLARILSICDTFDAIVADRPYKPGHPVEYALEQIKKNKNTQFDPKLVDQFISFIDNDLSNINEIISYKKTQTISE